MDEKVCDIDLHPLQLKSQESTLATRKQNAVYVRHAYKNYGTKSNQVNVLENLDMTVPRGCIYGLLGASGCGKTTLINCIVGRKRLVSGEMWVLGEAPGTRGSVVPGPRIGFMPQQMSLYGEFSIHETMKYFGWIADMNTEEIKERMQFLTGLLQLSDANKLIKYLSGGQQRRVSLAVALLHLPELLILDEPTVGLDPVLREIIWDHFLQITRNKNTTVILTTHYIDETRQANFIGLIRGGYIIAEESPQGLLIACGTETLEEAFLKLSITQNLAEKVKNNVSISGTINTNASADGLGSRFASLLSTKDKSLPKLSAGGSHGTSFCNHLLNFKLNRIKTLIWKNFLWLLRNVTIMFTILALPPVTTAMFYMCIGNDPINFDIAMVNYETKNAACNQTLSCNGTELSCAYFGHLEKRGLNLIPYDSENKAIQSVLHGKTYASIVVRHNYSEALRARIEHYSEQKSWNILYSTIDVFRDVSVKDIAIILQLHMYESLKVFLEEYMASCGENSEGLTPPVKFKPPIYGVQRPQYSDFTTPAIVLTLDINKSFISKKINNNFLQAVNPLEILLAHIIVDSVLVIGQIAATLIVAFSIFKMTANGSFLLVIILTMLSGFCGMCFGFAISSVCDSEYLAVSIVAGLFIPTSMISGLFWPIEGMHIILQKMSTFLPFTKANDSMRSILQRGWGITKPTVYYGFISLFVWILIFLIVSVLCLKFKKS